MNNSRVGAFGSRGSSERPAPSQIEAEFRARGIMITEEGKALWRERLRTARENWSLEEENALRRLIGRPELPDDQR